MAFLGAGLLGVHPMLQLLKEVLELEQVRTKDGRTRFTIKTVEETLTFDKGFYVFVRCAT